MVKSILLLALVSLFGTAIYKLGSPSVHAYPMQDGTMVMKFTLSRMPSFVAYFKTNNRRRIQPKSE